MFKVFKKNIKSTALLLVIGFFSSTNLYAYTGGVSGFDGNTSVAYSIGGCMQCHSGTAYNYSASLTVNNQVTVNNNSVLKGETVSIQYNMTNGGTAASKSGFTMSATGGTLATSLNSTITNAGTGNHVGGELHHKIPSTPVSGHFTWGSTSSPNISWSSSTAGPYTINVCGLVTNGSGSSGDGSVNNLCKSKVITVQGAPTITVAANDFTEDNGAAVGQTAATYVKADVNGDATTVSFTPGTNLNNHYQLGGGVVQLAVAGVTAINVGATLDAINLTVTDDGAFTLTGTGSDTPEVFLNNDAPMITVNANNFDEDDVTVVGGTTAGTYVTADEDDAINTLTVTFTAGANADGHYVLNNSINEVQLTTAGVAAINAGGPLNVIDLTVTDSGTKTGTDSKTPQIALVNDAPSITVNANNFDEDDVTVVGGTTAGTYVTADEDDAINTLTVTFTAGANAEGHYVLNNSINEVQLTTAGVAAINAGGPLNAIDLTVTDSGTKTGTDSKTPQIALVNDAPSITVNANNFDEDDVTVVGGTTAGTYVMADEDNSINTLTVTFTAGANADGHYVLNNSINEVQLTTAGVAAINAGGPLNAIDLTVTDSGTKTGTDSKTPQITLVNDAPAYTGSPSENAIVGLDYGIGFAAAVSASDEEGNTPIVYSITENSGASNILTTSWLSFNTSSGVLSGTPLVADDATSTGTLIITATDSLGAATSLPSFSITVSNTNTPPTISGTPVVNATEDVAYVGLIPAGFDANSDTLHYAITEGGNAGLSTATDSWLDFNTSNGQLTGTPLNANVGTTGPLVITVYDIFNTTDPTSGSLPGFIITVANTNDAPTITVTANDFTQDSGVSAGTTAGTYVTADVDNDIGAGDILSVSFTPATNINGHYILNAGVVQLTTAGVTAINAGTPLDTIALTVTDDGVGPLSGTGSDTPLLTTANDVPTITVTALDFTEDTGVVVGTTAGTYVMTDEDSTDILTVTFTSGTNTNGHYVLNAGVVQLTAAGITAIDSGTALDTIDLTVTDNGVGLLFARSSDTPVVTAVNDKPVVVTSAGVTSYTEGGTAIIDTAVTVDDVDSTQLIFAEVQLTTNFQTSEDILNCPTTDLTCVYSNINGLLTLTGTADKAVYNNALQAVTYSNSSGTPSTLNRTVRMRVRDTGNLFSVDAFKTISVADINSIPVFTVTSPHAVTMSKNGSPTAFALTLNATDLENDPISWIISSQGSNGGTASVSGTGNSKSISYTPVTDFSGDDSFDVQISDGNGGITTLTVNVTVANDDIDNDTISNTDDNCVNDANTDQLNTDNDLLGDVCDDDDDNDGVSDTLEQLLGLNSLSAGQLTIPADIAINATGHKTPVNLGVGLLTDSGQTLKLKNDGVRSYRPGHYDINWSINGFNVGESQNLDIKPLVNLSSSQLVREGSTATINIVLNGDAIEYPVTVDYSLSGSASAADHDLVSGTATISVGRSVPIDVNTVADTLVEGTETLILTLSNPINAALGAHKTHTLSITEANIAPVISIDILQNSKKVSTLYQDQPGTIEFFANVLDSDSTTVDWTQSDAALVALDIDATENVFKIVDATGIATGVYKLKLIVSDGELSSAVTRFIRVESNAPLLVATEDTDNDGIPDYLDTIDAAEFLPNQSGDISNVQLLQTQPGLRLKLGSVASSAGRFGAMIRDTDISDFNTANGSAIYVADDKDQYGGLFDFEIHNLTPGAKAYVVVPLETSLRNSSVYRKYDVVSGWKTFVTDANNSIASAKGELGSCPEPGSVEYADGLTAFDYCVQLEIQDGGPNDADGEENGIILDPGSFASDSASITNTNTICGGAATSCATGGSIGAIHPLFLVLSLLALTRIKTRLKKFKQ